MTRVMVVGGYGNAGAAMVDLLLSQTDVDVDIAGRHGGAAADVIAARPEAERSRMRAVTLDARNADAVADALIDVDLIVVAAGSTDVSGGCAEAALTTRTDYLDIQFNHAKELMLTARDAEFAAAGVCAITDGGFHPGVPGAMIRHVAARVPALASARVSSVISVDWGALRALSDSTVDEVLEEFGDYRTLALNDGAFTGARSTRRVDFGAPFGRRRCAAMDLLEIHEVAADLPWLRDAGFYVAGFNPVVDYGILPVIWLGAKVGQGRPPAAVGRLLQWGLTRFARPPFGAVLQLDGAGFGQTERTLMRVGHADSYVLTAAPAVATAVQLLDGSARRPGVRLQATAVDTDRFFADLAAYGVSVDIAC